MIARASQAYHDAAPPRTLVRGLLFAVIGGFVFAALFVGASLVAAQLGFQKFPLGIVAVLGGVTVGIGLRAPYRRSARPGYKPLASVQGLAFGLLAVALGYAGLAAGLPNFDFQPADVLGIIMAPIASAASAAAF